jgi:hypothetical protein
MGGQALSVVQLCLNLFERSRRFQPDDKPWEHGWEPLSGLRAPRPAAGGTRNFRSAINPFDAMLEATFEGRGSAGGAILRAVDAFLRLFRNRRYEPLPTIRTFR